jgi:uncharacterized ferritin-like protein (DUF455 family)
MTRTAGTDREYEAAYHAAYKRKIARKKWLARIAFAEARLKGEKTPAIRDKIRAVIAEYKAKLDVIETIERHSGFVPRGNRWYNHSKKGA